MGERPAHVKPPAYLSKSPPVPLPAPPSANDAKGRPDDRQPTRYGDWELNGLAIDF